MRCDRSIVRFGPISSVPVGGMTDARARESSKDRPCPSGHARVYVASPFSADSSAVRVARLAAAVSSDDSVSIATSAACEMHAVSCIESNVGPGPISTEPVNCLLVDQQRSGPVHPDVSREGPLQY